MSNDSAPAYAGDLSVGEVWDRLQKQSEATLIDVRTRPEWTYVGVCDLSEIAKQPAYIEWQVFPSMQVASDFTQNLHAELAARGVGLDAPLFFICRSGVRSKAAAIAMTGLGYEQCFNIADGFEGQLDTEKHRGRSGGWKAAGLPWQQN